MNNKVVIAGLVGAATAADPVPCDNMLTGEAEAALNALEITKEGLEFATTELDSNAQAEATLKTTADGRVTAQETLMGPFNTALATATTNWSAQNTAVTDATAAIAALTAPIAAAGVAKSASQALVTAQEGKITAQQTVVNNMSAAVTEHTAELAAMQVLLTAADTALTTANSAKSTAEASVATLIAERDTASTGQAALSTAADTTYGVDVVSANPATGSILAFNTANANLTADTAYQTAKLAFDKGVKLLAVQDAGCAFTDGTAYDCKTYTGCPIRAIRDTQSTANTGTLTSNLTTPTSTWNGLVTALAQAQDTRDQASAAKTVANANLATINASITSLQATYAAAATGPPVVAEGALVTTINSKTTLKATAQTNYDTTNGQLTQATTDHTRGAALLATLQAALVPLNEDLTVKKYLETIETDKLAVQEAAKAAGNLGLTDLLTLKNDAQATVDRANLTLTFYQGLATSAAASKTLADQWLTDNTEAITKIDEEIAAGKLEVAAAIAECKGNGYEKAQAALKALMDAEEGRRIATANVKVDYEAKAAFSTGGETNTLCGFPPKAKDAAQEPRPACKEGFCCGAAQKFLKDGTKLAIETCQRAEGVHTYTWFPPLPEGAVVEPTPETWRFQCISGAQKLIATATAALAASYMMA